MATAGTQAGELAGPRTRRLAAAYPDLVRATRRRAAGGARPGLLALPHGESQRLVPELMGQVGRRRRPGRRLPAAGPGALRHLVRARARGARAPRARSPSASPSCSGTRSLGTRLVAAPGCYPTAAALALAPLRPGRAVVPEGIVVDAASGVSGAGRRTQRRLHFGHGRRGLPRLRPARPPPHARDRAGARGRGAVHPAPGPDDAGDPGHLLRPAGRRPRRRRPPRLAMSRARPTRDEPFVVVAEGSPSTKATAGSNCAHVTRPGRPAHRVAGRPVRPRQPGKGRLGQAVQCANLAARAARDDRAAGHRGLPVSVTGPAGVRGRRGRGRHQGGGAPDVAVVATADGRPVPAAGVFTTNLAAGGAGAGQPGAPGRVRGHGGRGGAHVGQRQRRHRRAGGRRRRAGCASVVAGGIGVADRRGAGLPDRADRGAVSRSTVAGAGGRCRGRRRAPGPRTPAAAATAIMTTDTVARRCRSRPSTASRSAAMAKGAAMLAPHMATMLAVLTTDAAVDAGDAAAGCWPGRWSRRFNALTVDGCTSTNDTVMRPGERAGRAGRPEALEEALAEACALAGRPDGRRRRGGDQGGPDPGHRGRVRRRGPPGGPQGGRTRCS